MPRKGNYVDEWGSVWHVAEDGIIGEVKEPVLDDLSKIAGFSPPWEYLKSSDLMIVWEGLLHNVSGEKITLQRI